LICHGEERDAIPVVINPESLHNGKSGGSFGFYDLIVVCTTQGMKAWAIDDDWVVNRSGG